jgi:UPF0755 protein
LFFKTDCLIVNKFIAAVLRILHHGFRGITGIWFTGFIYIMAFLGYSFYGILWMVRLMQTTKKIIILCIVSFLLILSLGALWAWLVMPLGPSGHIVEMRVSPGTSLRSIAKSLEAQKIIRWAPALVLWMKVNGKEKLIQAGRVEFIEREGVIEAAKKLLCARPIEVTITVQEGLTIEQVAKVFLNSALKIDTTLFLSLCSNQDILKKHGISAFNMEGYLFPDTYRFPEKDSAYDIVNKMVDRFMKTYDAFDSTQIAGSELTMHQLVTLASIIEKEAQKPSERVRISSVFHNRLKKGIPLGADPTVRYIFKNFSGPIYMYQLKSKSPYNTRLFPGLPPGPICSPGKASLQAAIAPAQTKDLFFVAKWDGSGAHDFSTNCRDHEMKKEMIRTKNKIRLAKIKNAQ